MFLRTLVSGCLIAGLGAVAAPGMNASSQNDIDVDFLPLLPLMVEQGYAYVAVTAQQVTVDFLRNRFPEGYGSLNMAEVPGNAQPAAFEVFSQAGMALLENGGTSVDPLGGLQAEHLIAIGQSQSSGRLTTYVNTIHGLVLEPVPLTLAETASVFGEMLVFRRLLREEPDPKTRLALVCGKVEDAFATVFRQVVMTRFEQKPHAARRSEGELPIERISALWMEANRPIHGDAVRLTDDYAWWWLYIPHIVHSPFYCYAYAFGELLVLALLRRYDAEGAAFVPRYLALLRAGGSDSPAALFARIGLDVADPRFWDGGVALLAELVAEAERLAGD